MVTSFDISREIFSIDMLTALKSSLKHRRKHVLRSLQLYGDQALIYLNCKRKTLVYSLRYAVLLVKKQYTVMWQVLWLSPSPEQARPYVEASERKL